MSKKCEAKLLFVLMKVNVNR